MRRISSDRYISIANDLIERGSWVGFGLFDALDPARAASFDVNARECPGTRAVIERIPGLLVSAFLYMEAGTQLQPHRDAQDPRFLRFHLALEAGRDAWLQVGEQKLSVEMGRCVGFDPRIEHGAANEGETPRIVLFVDVLMEEANKPVGVHGPT